MTEKQDKFMGICGCKPIGRRRFGFVQKTRAALFHIPLRCIDVLSRLAMIFVLLAQGLERGSYEPDVTGSIPVRDKIKQRLLARPMRSFFPRPLFPFL